MTDGVITGDTAWRIYAVGIASSDMSAKMFAYITRMKTGILEEIKEEIVELIGSIK